MQKSFMLQVNPEKELHAVSDMLFGIFLEDINFTCDGGLNANLVNNHSFDGVYYTTDPKAKRRSFFKGEPRGDRPPALLEGHRRQNQQQA